MDWSQFADPQFLLGVGVIAFGAINAYMLRRHNLQRAEEEAEHSGVRGNESVKRQEVRESTETTECSRFLDDGYQKEKCEKPKSNDWNPTENAAMEGKQVKKISVSFRKLFRNRSVSKTRDPFSSTHFNPKSTKMDHCNRSRLSKSLSTFFVNCCQCCACCYGWGNTTDSPPYADDFHHRCRGPWKKSDRVSASEPQLSPPPPTVLPSIRVRFENQIPEMEGKDHISRRKEVGQKFRDEVDAEIISASLDDQLMLERKLDEGNAQRGRQEDEFSESSETVTIEPNSVSLQIYKADFVHQFPFVVTQSF
ncbi:unnamed protein product [Hydatigera taeniaeformis]|uniref:DUF4808 domain-containing protein n=1 Tax=Hydatigena taeniaeformis TaxID=6205 RepID=A0A0R3WIF6_HYDTA|nr:unnamed protein product [Hydatigera taeniaeformis]